MLKQRTHTSARDFNFAHARFSFLKVQSCNRADRFESDVDLFSPTDAPKEVGLEGFRPTESAQMDWTCYGQPHHFATATSSV
jgi:hypothetical protein